MVADPSTAPCRPTLRKLLSKLFPLEADFDAFVIDGFPEVKQRLTTGPDQIARVNLLFELATVEKIWAFLCEHYAERLHAHANLLRDDARQSQAARQREELYRELTKLQKAIDTCREHCTPTEKLESRMFELRRKLRMGRQVDERSLLLNRYHLMEKLGEGGFATVWQARDSDPAAAGTDAEIVAVKVLLGHHHDNDTILRRFQRGAREMKELEHPHIVRVLAGPHEDDELHFFVMEYLPGGDLRHVVETQQGDETHRIAVILQIGEALHYAHSRGILHRDVTPANILLDRARNAKLCDFDLVLLRDSSTVAGRSVHGTLAFAAPELLGNGFEGFAPQLDVYALGMTALYALTGREVSVMERSQKLQGEIEKLPYGQSVRDVLSTALAWEANRRYATMMEFCLALRAAWENRGAVLEITEVAAIASTPTLVKTNFITVGSEATIVISSETLVIPDLPSSINSPVNIPSRYPWHLATFGVMAIFLIGLGFSRLFSIGAMKQKPSADLGLNSTRLLDASLLPADLLSYRQDLAEKPTPITYLKVGEMKKIVGGTFKMGAEDLSNAERPEHDATVKTFFIDITEVTVAAYQECVDSGGCTKAGGGKGCNFGKKDRRNHPINCVDWQQAKAYCDWADKRLPTEKEWEYAARGRVGRAYPWGGKGQDDPRGRVCSMNEMLKGTCPVRSYENGKTPNGIYDMSGNVWEWLIDAWRENYASRPQTMGRMHAIRGGAWSDQLSGELRAVSRMPAEARQKDEDIGFRCARD